MFCSIDVAALSYWSSYRLVAALDRCKDKLGLRMDKPIEFHQRLCWDKSPNEFLQLN
jgi:hypothetical protein